MGTPTARHPYLSIDPRAVFGEGGPNAFDIDNRRAFRDVWGTALVESDFFRQYMVKHETEMPVRWDTLEPVLEVMVREGDSYTVVATISWVRTVVEDEISQECYDCGEDALVATSAWGNFLLSGEGESNAFLAHGLVLQFIDLILREGHTVTIHAIV